MGLFAIPEMMKLITRGFIIESDIDEAKTYDIKKFFSGALATFKYIKTLIRSILIGVFIGTLPAAGSTVACLMSYSQAKSSAKSWQRYGEGEPEGVVAAEGANNASEGGAMAILLALGIPGSGATAILIAGFMLHGLNPGPNLFRDNAALVYGLISANFLQMLLLGFCALFFAFYLSRIIFVPTNILAPSLMLVLAVGAYCVRYLFFDIYLVFFFGVLGWFFRQYDFPTVSFIIGYILGKRLDMEVYRFKALFGSDLLIIFKQPISVILILMTALTIGLQIYRNKKRQSAEDG